MASTVLLDLVKICCGILICFKNQFEDNLAVYTRKKIGQFFVTAKRPWCAAEHSQTWQGDERTTRECL